MQNTFESLQTLRQIERVVSLDEYGKTGPQFLVKWKGLGYDECTWEDSELVSKLALTEIDLFLNRQSNEKIPGHGKFPSSGSRGIFRKIETQPKFLNFSVKSTDSGKEEQLKCNEDAFDVNSKRLTLRDYQLEGLNWLAYSWTKNINVILADEMGLGKTIQTTSFISWLFHEKSIYGPFLIVVPLSTLGSWQKELQKWAPQLNIVVFNGNAAAKQNIVEYEFYQTNANQGKRGKGNFLKFNILLTTFEQVVKEKDLLGSINWALLVVDEAHRLKNAQSQIHETLLLFHTSNRVLVTGTPLQNNVKELWGLLSFLMPEKFHSWEDFESKYASISQESQVNDLHSQLRPHILRRVKKDVEKSLPPKSERILRVELSPAQQRIYRLILTKNYRELNKGIQGKQASLMNVMNELKKVSNHALFFESYDEGNYFKILLEYSGKMVLLDKLLTRLKESGHRVLIFSQMVKMLDYIGDYLSFKKFHFQRLDGSTGNEARKKAIEHFNAPGSIDFCFILSTRAGGLGINLETADTVIIFDSDWNPQNDLQAMARAHRIGQRNTVNIYRLVSKGTVEEEILEKAKKKMVLDHVIIQRLDTSGGAMQRVPNFSKEELQAILQFGAKNLFLKQSTEDEQSTADGLVNLDEILERAEVQDSSSVTSSQPCSPNEDFLSQFKVADFGSAAGLLDWSEIIPKEEIELQETEELVAKEKELYQSMMERERKKEAVIKAIKNQEKKAPSEKKKIVVELPEFDILSKARLKEILKICLHFGTKTKSIQNMLQKDEIPLLSVLDTIAREHVNENSVILGRTVKNQVSFHPAVWIKRTAVLNYLAELIEAQSKGSLDSFRLTSSKIKQGPTSKWEVTWGIPQDSMLLAGVYLHGLGNWDLIFEDKSLKLPNFSYKPDQLMRRFEYVMDTLITNDSKLASKSKSIEKTNITVKTQSKKRSESASKALTGTAKKQTTITERFAPKQIMKPVKEALQRISALEEPIDVSIVCECLREIGSHISTQSASLQPRLWEFASLFWPTADANGDSLADLYQKILAQN